MTASEPSALGRPFVSENKTEFKEWWEKRLALRSFPIPEDALPFAKGYAQAAWEEAYRRYAPVTSEGHQIELRLGGWTIQHPLSCRPNLFECEVNRAAEKQLTEPPGTFLGVYDCWLDKRGRFHVGQGG